MSEICGSSDSPRLRQENGCTSFVDVAGVVDVPSHCVQKSDFLENILDPKHVAHTGKVDLPLPLRMTELRAWVAFAEAGEDVDQDNETLIQALTVRFRFAQPSIKILAIQSRKYPCMPPHL